MFVSALKTRAGPPTRRNVDQVSLPMRIALLAVLAFAGLWLVALRPKPAGEAVAPVTPAAKQEPTGVTGAAKKAEVAAAKADAKTAKTEKAAEAAGEGTAPKAAAPSKPSVAKSAPKADRAAKGPAATPGSGTKKTRTESVKVKRVLADLDKKKVVVLLFWDRRSSDDREVYRAVEQIDRHDGKVSVRAAPIQKLGDYDPVTKGLPIAGSPSVVVIDEAKRASVITGLTVTAEVNAQVKRALKRK